MAWSDLLETADRAILATFPTTIVYAPGDGTTPPATITGVFSNASDVAQGEGLSVVGQGPKVFLRMSDLPTDPTVDTPTLTINGATYTVREPMTDGEGGVSLLLYEVS